jgi:hypothetical protein
MKLGNNGAEGEGDVVKAALARGVASACDRPAGVRFQAHGAARHGGGT